MTSSLERVEFPQSPNPGQAACLKIDVVLHNDHEDPY